MTKLINGGLDHHTASLSFECWDIAWHTEVAYVQTPSSHLVKLLDVKVQCAVWLDNHVTLFRSDHEAIIRSQANQHLTFTRAAQYHLEKRLAT